MDIQTLISDVDTLCDNEAATGSSGYLSNVRYVLKQLASYVARREQGIEARVAGMVDTALGIETRADAHIAQIVTDGEAMTRPVQPVTESKRRLPTLADDEQDESA